MYTNIDFKINPEGISSIEIENASLELTKKIEEGIEEIFLDPREGINKNYDKNTNLYVISSEDLEDIKAIAILILNF